MCKTRTLIFLCLLSLTCGSAGAGQPEADWIRVGTFIDWPESLRGGAPEFDPLPVPAEAGGMQLTSFSTPVEVIDAVAVLEETPEVVLPVAGEFQAYSTARTWHLLPEGILYPSYLAGEREPRFASQWLWERDRGQIWEAALGGRLGLIRKGTPGPDGQGFQFDVEGGVLLRIDPLQESDPLEAADFRAGLIGTWRRERWRYKTGYSHVSSHLGDEFLLNNPGFVRRNYVRDSILFGTIYDVTPDLQVYGEIAAAVIVASGGAEPLELQFGAQYRPACPTGFRGAPFAAINGHLRQEFNFGGSVNVQAGWAWKARSTALLRAGFQHYNGPSMQWSFFDRYESLTGMALWYDF